jgi:UDP-glucose 4-epimerase
MSRYFIAGGAGFIGSHLTDRLLADSAVEAVTLYDNFSSGRRWHFEHHLADRRLSIIEADVKDANRLAAAMDGHQTIVHLASNPDIARAATEPDIDFVEGTLLTRNVIEAMRRCGCPRILYVSGSGIYGDLGTVEADEDHGPLAPISTYGASKLAGEAMISAYVHMFGLRGAVFRLGNVVGPRQTHGVGLDFARRLMADGSRLSILGDGTQSKSYIHVDDVVSALLFVETHGQKPFDAFNVATGDYITVTEIADLAAECLGLEGVAHDYTSGDRGWKGDVPVVRLNTDRIRALGWRCQRSAMEAMRAAIDSLIVDLGAGRL